MARTDVDAVDLIITIDSMPEFVEKALAAGKHVLSEKPMAPSVSVGRKMLQNYRTKHAVQFPGLIWSVAEQLWYEPCWKMLLDYREEGWHPKNSKGEYDGPAPFDPTSGASPEPRLIGSPLVATLTRVSAMNSTNKYYVTKWRAQPQYQGGYILDGGVHEICKLRMMFGDVEEVAAITHQFKSDLPPADTLTCSLKFTRGIMCTFTYTFTSVSPQIATATVPHDIMITGSSGSIHAKNNELVINFVDVNGDLQRHVQYIDNEQGQLSIRREIEAFALAALGGQKDNGFDHYTPEQALQDVAVIEAILSSAKDGTRTKVESI